MRQAKIVTASPLADDARAVLEARFRTLLGGEVSFVYEEDPTRIGGFTAYVDGRLYDMSILTRLEAVRAQITKDFTIAASSAEKAGMDDLKRYTISVGEHMRETLREMESGAVSDYGTVESCADGVVQIKGLEKSLYGELLEFENNAYGMALELTGKGVGAVLFSGASDVFAGSIVRGTGRVLDVSVGPELLGRVVDPLGRPLDGRPLHAKMHRPLECPAPTIMDRVPVSQPLLTGILAVDSMIPIGRGQRELIIGDRQMGKSVIALSAVRNQTKNNVICVYCAIGQKASTIAQLIETLTENGSIEHCVVVAATASDSAAMQYIAPYAGCAIAESFMYAGRDVLIVYDDLSKHATSYRTMSLLLKRPPGRQAYPGDVFYLHSRLLERAAKLSPEKGGGSMTALPIVETMGGDISAYIPTNVISITDGQIYLEGELFHAGVRPAVNVGLSVSRVGRAAQPEAMRKVSGQLRLQLAQYREMAVFAQFDSDLDASTQQLLDSGARLTELLKQDQNTVYTLADEVAILLAFEAGHFNAIPVREIGTFKAGLCTYIQQNGAALSEVVNATGALSDSDRAALLNLISAYRDATEKEASGVRAEG